MVTSIATHPRNRQIVEAFAAQLPADQMAGEDNWPLSPADATTRYPAGHAWDAPPWSAPDDLDRLLWIRHSCNSKTWSLMRYVFANDGVSGAELSAAVG